MSASGLQELGDKMVKADAVGSLLMTQSRLCLFVQLRIVSKPLHDI
jgi:hypothetical protein